MQDLITDDPMNLLRMLENGTRLYKENFLTCSTCEQQPWFSFFFDGTGNNLERDEKPKKLSNIARLYWAHRDESPLIVPKYYPGVGTPLDASNAGWWEKLRDSEALGGGAGLGWDARLSKAEGDFRDLLKYNRKVSRIDIAVFGFSRGATLARAFVNRLLDKCTMKDGVPHWPCPTAVDGESAPLHFRFLGIFDTVESVGLPASNLSDMQTHVPPQVERCFHIVAAHELRACFPLTPVRGADATYEEIVMPGVHSDVGGGYRPEEQARSDLYARIPLNKMRLEAIISGVKFHSPKQAEKAGLSELFEYDEEVKSLFDEYMRTVGAAGSLEQQVFEHMRYYYAWLKIRFGHSPFDIYKGVSCVNPTIDAELERIRQLHGRMTNESKTMNWRAWLTHLWHTDRDEYGRTIDGAGGEHPLNKPLDEKQLAYWNAWLNPPALSPNLLRFFDRYMHDSRAGFLDVDSSGYLRPRRIMDVPWDITPAANPDAASEAVRRAGSSPETALSPGWSATSMSRIGTANSIGI
ncbi:T6SS phospholipase effector Tle1-like catalytic domain-containing protein [Pandoraea norimbergensis]|uniref:T6SS phospholipase effector Tle1-like catalytic domain-containing protein n=1 Tax=Pandoraea norimbergensis TaxID=93219 RepID=UPI0009FCFA7A|nr:DUF2235 domain-containing protein [Pandoraea norimbergensis]